MRVANLVVLLIALTSSAMAQDSASDEPHGDAFWYGRFGYGRIAGESRYGGVSLGFGRRIERNAIGIDLLLFSAQIKLWGTTPDIHQIDGVYTHARTLSLLTVKGLYLIRPRSATSPYVGAGAGWRTVSFGRSVGIDEQWHGRGLEGDVTFGYAFARSEASTRFFVEGNLTHPFYRATRYSDRVVVTGSRLAPLFVLSLGAGW